MDYYYLLLETNKRLLLDIITYIIISVRLEYVKPYNCVQIVCIEAIIVYKGLLKLLETI